MSRFDGCRKYADADKSDPFAFSRAMTHNLMGIDTGDYSAKTTQVERVDYQGQKYKAKAFKDMKRP